MNAAKPKTRTGTPRRKRTTTTLNPFNSVHPKPYAFSGTGKLTDKQIRVLRSNFVHDVVRCVQANPRLSWPNNIKSVQGVHPIYEMFGKKSCLKVLTPSDMAALKSSRSDARSSRIVSRASLGFVDAPSRVSSSVRKSALRNNTRIIGMRTGVMDVTQMTKSDWGSYLESRIAPLRSESPVWSMAIQACVASKTHQQEARYLQAWAAPITNQAAVNAAYLNAKLF